MPKPKLTIHTAGGCEPHPGPGGWAASLAWEDGRLMEVRGFEPKATNQRLELLALVQALKLLEAPSEVTALTDSSYVAQALTQGWLSSWKKNGWRTAQGHTVKNLDLWQELDQNLGADGHEIVAKLQSEQGADPGLTRCRSMLEEIRALAGAEAVAGAEPTGPAMEKPASEPAQAAQAAPGKRTATKPEPTSRAENQSAPWPRVEVFGDGGCRPNPGPGGWGALVRNLETRDVRELSGYEAKSTNNRMELTAVTVALDSLPEPCRVSVTTDSQYVANAFRQGWLAKWKRNGWKTATGDPVKNKELWEKLDQALQRHQVTWKWIKGHSGHAENERCDELATEAIQNRRGRGA